MAASVKVAKAPVAEICAEPECQALAQFTVRHDTQAYAFCWDHVWPRIHRWLGKLPRGEVVTVSSLTNPEPKLPG